MLTLSDIPHYFYKLDDYRQAVQKTSQIDKRKRLYASMFGQSYEKELHKLLDGEFAEAISSYNIANNTHDGLNIISLKSGSLTIAYLEEILSNYAKYSNKNMAHIKSEYRVDREKSFIYYSFPIADFVSTSFGELFTKIDCAYALVLDNYLIFASSKKMVETIVKSHVHNDILADELWYTTLNSSLAKESSFWLYSKLSNRNAYLRSMLKNTISYSAEDVITGDYQALGVQLSREGELLYFTSYLNKSKIESELTTHLMWQTQLGAKQILKPAIVTNHTNKANELLVQDSDNVVYLINDAGRILWKHAIEAPINSYITQVDIYKNGKLQYLFSTENKIYLIDRNGNNVGRFPIVLASKCVHGISVFDYNKDKNYRIFVPSEDNKIYLYGLDGNIVQGWKAKATDKQITSRVKHFTVNSKDYIVYTDKHRLYILDRQGRTRVNVKNIFEFTDHVDIYCISQGNMSYLVLNGNNGIVYKTDFNGKVSKFQIPNINGRSNMNIGDVNRDGRSDLIFTHENQLVITDVNGKEITRKIIDGAQLEFPYIYRFSSTDIRLGFIDKVNKLMYMVKSNGDLSSGFPISGDSNYSITLTDGAFYLYTGVEGRDMIKYKVKR